MTVFVSRLKIRDNVVFLVLCDKMSGVSVKCRVRFAIFWSRGKGCPISYPVMTHAKSPIGPLFAPGRCASLGRRSTRAITSVQGKLIAPRGFLLNLLASTE